jgi:signal transduction histidine kinase
MAPPLLSRSSMDPRVQHRQHLQALALRRLPMAMLAILLFIGGALPLDWYYYPSHLIPYLAVYAVEVVLCIVAYIVARRWQQHALTVAAAWAAAMGVCVAAYYPLAAADATLAMAALICLVAAMPAIMPFGLRHQAALGAVCAVALGTIIAAGVSTSLPAPYVFIAMSAVISVSSIGAHSAARFRWEAFHREASLRQAHEHLRTALARAESAAEMRSRLVANVSHELRTPLNVIVGYTDMLIDAAADAPTVTSIAPRIHDYAVSLETLVNELLDFSRLSHGKVDLTFEDIQVPTLLDEVAEGARLLLGGKPVRVEVRNALPIFHCDRLHLRQILYNLAANAAKFTQEGCITIAARGDRGHAIFEVRDTGCGIPAAKHEAIFTAFEQVTPSGKSGSGIGLGLAIVRQLTDLLGGTVTVSSSSGTGATFVVTLPHPTPATYSPSRGVDPEGAPRLQAMTRDVAALISATRT